MEISSPACVSPGWSDEPFMRATSNMAQDPTSWLPIKDSVASPIVKGGIIVTPNSDTTVVAVSNEGTLVQDNNTKEKFHLSPLQSFFEDELGLVSRVRDFNKLRLGICHAAYAY